MNNKKTVIGLCFIIILLGIILMIVGAANYKKDDNKNPKLPTEIIAGIPISILGAIGIAIAIIFIN
jgi:hypothetical protein